MQAAIDAIHAIYHEHGISDEEADVIWQGMAAFCAYQLCNSRGPFAKLVKEHPESVDRLLDAVFLTKANPFSKN